MLKNRIPIFLLAALLTGCTAENTPEQPNPSTFSNPILSGFNPDPSICRVGEDFYMVNSSFAYFPGIPVLHSRDMVHWEQIGSAIDRNSQLDLTGHGFSRGLYAPAISYHDGWFYIVGTLVDTDGNFIVRSQTPEGPYSDPIWLPELNGGIDPSLFFDENGKVYVVYNQGPPNSQSQYSGHRTIRMHELDPVTFHPIGEEYLLVNGGVDISQEPVWIEGPHIYQKGDTYYLMCAEGGTAYDHSEVLFKSNSATGGYVPYEQNPILTQRHLDPDRSNPITSTGHADIIELPSGEWWAVFLGCRPYEGGHYNTGRETFLAPVRWEGDWFRINPDFEEVQYEYPAPATDHITVP
ncbi:MAG: glycoside hydrolase family 43 protein, partial [Phaeodactylibacter sp.]|nr:glycoside hydrolase family 43 protein [Phaeodactylibacter sp.]